MAIGLCKRSVLRAAFLLALLATPRASSAQDIGTVNITDEFYQAVSSPGKPVASSTDRPSGTLAAATRPSEINASLTIGVEPSVATKPALPLPRVDRNRFLGFDTPPLSLPGWSLVLTGIASIALFLWLVTPLPCLLLGHRRSTTSLRFSQGRGHWVSSCKRCRVALYRDPVTGWARVRRQFDDQDEGATPVPQPLAPGNIGALSTAPELNLERPEVLPNHSTFPRETSPENGPVQRPNNAKAVTRLLHDVIGGSAPAPGARGALFFLVDELCARPEMEEQTLRAMKISVCMQQLECALQRGDDKEAKSARRELRVLAGEWTSARDCLEK
jgi:hypothetical protein